MRNDRGDLLERIKELTEQVDALDSSWERAKQRWHTAEQQLDAVRELPEKWRDESVDYDGYCNPWDICAGELEQLIK